MHKSYYAIIPANVRYDKDLPANAKLLYGEITALANEKGYCWASNAYFADLYAVSQRTIIRWINDLADKKHIISEKIYKENSKEIAERRLWIATKLPSDKSDIPSCQSCHEPSDKSVMRGSDRNVTDNNTSFNNTFNNTVNKRDIVEQSPTSPLPYADIIDYLNQKTGKNFKSAAKATQKNIKARFNDGFTLEDFKRVIDIKCEEWLKDSKMSTYLRPETLFGTKFEGYLNSKPKPKPTGSYIDSTGLTVL